MTSKFITLLDKIGSEFKLGATKAFQLEMKALPAEQAVANVLAVVDPPLGITLQEILTPIAKVEQVAVALKAATGTGPQKLAIALPEVEAVLASDPLFAGKIPANLDLYNKAIEAITSSFADLLNSYQAAPTAPAA